MDDPLARADPLARVPRLKSWSGMDASTRRALAEQACRDADRQALWSLTEACVDEHRTSGRPLSHHTIRTYRQSINALLDRWSGQTLLHPTRTDVESFVRELERSGSRVSTIKVRLAGVRALYRALNWAGVLDVDPFEGAHPSVVDEPTSRARRPYSDEEEETLLRYAEPVDRAMILLCARSGLSVSECVGLRWSDVDLATGRLELRASGGEPRRVVPLPPSVTDALDELPQYRTESVLGFTSDVRARQRMKQLCVRAGVAYRGVQALRLGSRREANKNGQNHHRAAGRAQSVPGDRRETGGIPDYDALKEELTRVAAEADRTGTTFGLVTIDIEQLPRIVDEHGRDMARELAQTLAARINRIRRPYDFVAHCPDQTFCVILKHIRSGSDLTGIKRRFLEAVDTHPFVIHGRSFAVSASMETAAGVDAAAKLMGKLDPEAERLRHSALN